MPIKLRTKIPGPKSVELMTDRMSAVARGPFHSTPIFIQRAHGAILEDVDGNSFIDFASGIGVTNIGHTHSSVTKAIITQSNQALHLSFNVTPYESYVTLCQKLNQISPGAFPKKTFLTNTGAEAVENAVKIARAFTGRSAIICFEHAFHGRTYMAMSLTSKVKPYRYGFGPFNSEVYRVPYPYLYRWPEQMPGEQLSQEHIIEACFRRFEEVVINQVGANQTAAVIIEPVLGEGGFVPAPFSFLKKLREFCTAHGIVLIVDEIQTGFGRTGRYFACEHAGVEPDLITMAKGLGGGMPIAAITGRVEMMDAPIEGGIGGTYNGNPVSCAAALATIDEFKNGDLFRRAQIIAKFVEARLKKIHEMFPIVGDVRGLGMMRGFELVRDRNSKQPNPEATKALLKYCYEHGVVMLGAGTYSNVIRLLMPLVIEDHDLEDGLSVIEAGLKAIH